MIMLTLVSFTDIFGQATGDYQKTTDFSKYKSIFFAGWQKDSGEKINEFDRDRILAAFKSEFEERGIMFVDSSQADAALTIYIIAQKKTSTTAYTDYVGGYGYRGAWGYGGMGMGTATTNYVDTEYIQGTMIVDVYDETNKDLLWQGILRDEVSENPKKRAKRLPKNIAKLMKQYPVDKVKD